MAELASIQLKTLEEDQMVRAISRGKSQNVEKEAPSIKPGRKQQGKNRRRGISAERAEEFRESIKFQPQT